MTFVLNVHHTTFRLHKKCV